MTRLDAIKARERATQIAIEFSGLRATYVEEDRTWLLAQVEALAGALRQIDDIAAAHCRGAIGAAQYVARTALAALEAPDA